MKRELVFTPEAGEILGEKIFEAYAQQKTPSAYRIFWYYGPDKNQISIVTILPHPK